jgi:hypothetical protein
VHGLPPDCAQIGLGTPASFNANFAMKPTPPGGNRAIFGNYDVDPGRGASCIR